MAVKKAATEDKAVAKKAATGLVTVVVAGGPIHHGGRRYGPGDTLQVTPEVADALVGARLVTKKAR